jgi:hypothetical protein
VRQEENKHLESVAAGGGKDKDSAKDDRDGKK